MPVLQVRSMQRKPEPQVPEAQQEGLQQNNGGE